MKNISLIVLSLSLTLFGCASPKPKMTLIASFNKEQAQKLLESGTNTIKGSALMRQVGGGVVSCAGQLITLYPATDYATERITKLYGNDTNGFRSAFQQQLNPEPFESTDPEYHRLSKTATCDAQGFFKFEKVTNGTFYITSQITWKSNPNSASFEGGAMMRKISVSGGETKEIVIAP